MKFLLLVILGIFSATLQQGLARQTPQFDMPDEVDEGGEEEEVDVAMTEAELARERVDLCKKVKCYRGEVCRLNHQRKAECVCLDNCQPEVDVRYHVCSTRNDTYKSECLLDREHCLCKRNKPGCSNPRTNKIQLDYYGQCKELSECPENEFSQFPSRMREWLFVVMKQLAARDMLGEYLDMLEKAKGDANFTEAVLWKFCDLDNSPQDSKVSRRELQYIVQSLKAWEHCLVPFLAECDENNDRKITLKEWGKCLGVKPGKISDHCINIRKKARRH